MNEPKSAVHILRQVPIFRELSPEEIEQLGSFAISRTYRKRNVVFNEGDEKEAVYFIQSGMIKTYKTDHNGHEHIVSFLRKGDMFPHTGLFNANPYPATAEAIMPTALLALPIHPFELFLMQTPGVAVKIMHVMSEKINELQAKLQSLTGQDVQNRGQLFMLKLAENYGKEQGGQIHIDIPMTHQDIASTIGTTRESVSRLLNQWKKEGLVTTSRSGYIVCDLDALRHWREN